MAHRSPHTQGQRDIEVKLFFLKPKNKILSLGGSRRAQKAVDGCGLTAVRRRVKALVCGFDRAGLGSDVSLRTPSKLA